MAAAGKIKARKYDIANTNIANLGSDLEKEVKKTAAECEKEWKKAGKAPGLQIWRIEKFQVVPWPADKYGKFFSGDSYIILCTYKKEKRETLFYDLYFWIGESSSQDEYGTAAYKTVELDDYLNGAAVQYREIQGGESPRFKALFKVLQFMDGGVDSGFSVFKPLEYRPRLLQIKGKNNVLVREVPISHKSLNSGDCFIYDGGMKVFVWHGSNASPMEKSKAMSMAQALDDERGGRPDRKVFNEGTETDEFWTALNGKGPVRTEAEGGADDSQKDFHVPRLLVLSSKGGSALKLNVVAEGSAIKRTMLKSADVFIFDVAGQIFVWVGKEASKEERRYAMDFANQYMREYGRDPLTPFCKLMDGGENDLFESMFDDRVLAQSAMATYKGNGGPGVATDFDALYQQQGVNPADWQGRAKPASAYSQELGGHGTPKPAAAAAAGAAAGAGTAKRDGADVPHQEPEDHAVAVQRTWSGPVVGSLVLPDNFDPKADANVLRKAMKGLGTNEDLLISVLCCRTQKQRAAIRENYRTFLSRDLEKDIIGDTSGNFRTFLKALVRSNEDRDSHFLFKCIKGLGTDNTLLIEMLCTKEAAQIKLLKESYKRAIPGQDLERDVLEDTSGDYQSLLLSVLQCKRPAPGVVDAKQAVLDAQALYRAGEGRLGTDEAKFIEIFTARSFTHLQEVFKCYKEGFKHDIRQAIIGETSGNFRRGLLTICDYARNPTEMFAYRLFKTMKGLGTHNLALIYTLIERSEIDLGTIKQIYPKKFGVSLVDQIKSDTSGDFRKALLKFIGE